MIHRLTLFLLLAIPLSACQEGPPVMLGEHNVLVVAPDPLWVEVEDSVRTGLWVRPTGLPAESPFALTHMSPDATSERDLRTYRQIVVMGGVGDRLVDEALPRADTLPSLPALARRADVWREGQAVVVLALGDTDGADAVLARAPDLAEMLHEQYRAWTRRRMYSMGTDAELGDSLTSVGVALAVPDLFRWIRLSDSTFAFTTPSNDIAQRLRSVLLTWRSAGEEEMAVSAVLDWRQEMADRAYDWEHRTQREPLEIRPLEESGEAGLEIRGSWTAVVDGQPHGGPFITRAVLCPEQGRRYLLDAWVFAPRRGKHRYLIQLETILDSFDCLDGGAAAG